MKSSRLILCLLLLLIAAASPSAAEIVDRVVASVGDYAITLYDIDKEGAALLNQINISSPPEEKERRLHEARKRIGDQLVEKMLLLKEAKRLGIEVGDDELESAVDKIKSENKITHEELVKALEVEGFTYERYREDLKRQILRAKVVDSTVKGSIDISEVDVRTYYESNIDDFRTDEEIRVRHILFTISQGAGEESVTEAKRRATEVLQMAGRGEDFAVLAEKYSEGPSAAAGGDLGFFKRGDMVAEFSDAAFVLEEGEVSNIVRTPFGFHIIKLIDRRGGSSLPFDDVIAKVRAKLYNEELEKGIKNLIRELRESGEVEIRL